MAKNKNRKQTGRQNPPDRSTGGAGTPATRAGSRQDGTVAAETGTDLHTGTQGGSRTKQRRFGHN